ncbi:hypothetical protein TOPH_08412 [Tolypocladium ophioglossoides CBS 100239]|uniref:Uncharacterized protein n=1 Tax=Tolypocladium ophioglossoides (strain CBS 100239) TaxID=1163406 RepID=A0A0L0MYR3_TOLOC|nr:hypothetical protein TOPH_08412 [Tolypocladium ophioglossoides CBS 100239]
MSKHAPVGESYSVKDEYLDHLVSWLGKRTWDAPMLCTKICPDYEEQQADQGSRFPVENLMKHAYQVHSHMVKRGMAGPDKDHDQRSVWREAFEVSNPYFVNRHPKIRQMVNDPKVQAADFLAEFFRFAAGARLTEKGVVVICSTDVDAWSKQQLD